MSLSNEQLRDVIGEGETRKGLAWTAQQLRNLIPTVQTAIGRALMEGEEASELQPLIDGGNSLDAAADMLDRLSEYLGPLES